MENDQSDRKQNKTKIIIIIFFSAQTLSLSPHIPHDTINHFLFPPATPHTNKNDEWEIEKYWIGRTTYSNSNDKQMTMETCNVNAENSCNRKIRSEHRFHKDWVTTHIRRRSLFSFSFVWRLRSPALSLLLSFFSLSLSLSLFPHLHRLHGLLLAFACPRQLKRKWRNCYGIGFSFLFFSSICSLSYRMCKNLCDL